MCDSKVLKTIFLFVAIATLFLYGGITKAKYVQNGLISYWTFDKADIDRDVVKDIIGNHNGTIVGKVKAVEGKINEALLFNKDDLRGDHVDVGVEINPKIHKRLTIEGWFKFVDRVKGSIHVLMCAREGGWVASKGISFLYSNGYQAEGFTMYFRMHKVGGPANLAYKPFEPELDKWYHYVSTYDSEELKFYVNGEEVAKLDTNEGPEKSSTSLKIAHSSLFGNKWDFSGVVDEVRIYNRALSNDEVKQNFASEGGVAIDYSIEKLSLTWGKIKVSR